MQFIPTVSVRVVLVASLAVAFLSVNPKANAACVDNNTCYGTDALLSTTGEMNSGFGYRALYNNTTAIRNTAIGFDALYSNTTGSANSASGAQALLNNTTGGGNTASGHAALYHNTTGYENTADGLSALFFNTTGYSNTASGVSALRENTTGYANAAMGGEALYYNTTGYYNTASGYKSLTGNTTGDFNTASGYFALANNFTGNRNTAEGALALLNATSHANVALGYQAGFNITTGGNNIIIGAGQKGRANDSGIIRIGSSTFQTKAIIAGIRGVTTGQANAVPVVIDGNGQLGTISSSRRFKDDIQPMGSVSDRLLELRPVTFHYKQPFEDGSTPVQFGLVAEEVAQVFPELVVYGEDGEPETVSYHLLSTLLVNEVQKDRRTIDAQEDRIAALERQVSELAAMVRDSQR